MKHSTNLMIRLYSLLVAVMAFGLNASADNRLSIEDFTITPGEEKELAVVLENADPVSSIQFDMTLPVGLEVTKVTKNADRLKSHNAGMRKQANGDVRVVVLTTATVLENTAFKGNEGAILTLKVKANSTFKGGQIKVHSIDASDATVAEPIERVIGDFTVKAKVNAGTFSVAPESINVNLAEGQEAQIDLSVANGVNIAGLQVDVQLPENLEVTEIVKGERVSDNYDPSPTEIAAGSSATVVLSSLMVENFEGNDGVVLSLQVKAVGEVDGKVTFSNVQTTDMSGDASFVMEGEGDVAVKFYYTYYKVAVAEGIENGTVTADKAEAKAGDKVALTITPAADYKLDVLTVTYGEEKTAVEVAEDNTFSMPEGDVAISATFVPLKKKIYIEVDMTNQFSALTEASNWTNAEGNPAGVTGTWACPEVEVNGLGKKPVNEYYDAAGCQRTGDMLYQTVKGLVAGTYKVELYGAAAFTFDRGFGSTAFTGDFSVATSDDYKAGDKIEPSETVSTGVTLYAESEGKAYAQELPIFYATTFPEGAAVVTLNGIEVGESGAVKIGMNKTSTSTNWHVIQLKSVIALVDAEEALAQSVAAAQAVKESDVPAALFAEIQNTIAEKNKAYETGEEYKSAIEAIDALVTKAGRYPSVKAYIDKMEAGLGEYNVYTEEAFAENLGNVKAAYEAGTLTDADLAEYTVNNAFSTNWHSVNKIDDILLSTWTFGDEQCKDYDKGLYINTWSVEGDNDGTGFKVPFFEYWTGDDASLGEKTLTATMENMKPGTYEVKAWVRSRAKTGTAAADAAGITLSVNGGEAVDVTEGETLAGQFNLDRYTATGVVAEDGVLKIQFNVAADNNISWLSFRDVNYQLVKEAEPEIAYADVKMTYVSNESVAGDADKAFGEVEEAYSGYNKIANGEVAFGNTGWNCNWITYIQVDASALKGGMVKSAKLTAEVSGSTDSKRTTTWGVGYNSTAWSADMTYNTADKSITTIGTTFAGTTKSATTFETAEFDITEAFAAGNKTATILVYETAAAGGVIKNVKVEVEMGDKEIEVDGIIYAIKSDNLIINGSFDEGVDGWKTVGYTTDAVIDNFGYATEGGFDNGAFITTNAAGVGSEKTLRQSVAVEPGKQYYFTVYTSGKAPDANNFNYNALFQMTDAVTENGVIKAFEWPQGAGQTAEDWSQTKYVFTAAEGNPFVGVRMGWNADSRFDGFALYEVEMKTSAVEAAKTLALAELDKLAPVGDGIFMYAQADIDAAKAAIEASETLEEIAAVEMPTPTTPDPDKQYTLALKTSDEASPFELSVSTEGIKIVEGEGTPVSFVAQEGGTYAISNGAEFLNYNPTGNRWDLSATEDAYGWTIAALPAGGYSITGRNGLFGTNTSDGNAAGSTCYGDKNTGNGNYIWTITAIEEPEIVFEDTPLTKDMFKGWDGFDENAQVINENPYWDAAEFGTSVGGGAVIYGSGNVTNTDYADITKADVLRISGTVGLPLRVMFNRQADNTLIEVDPVIGENGYVDVDLTSYNYVHLNAIKVNWGDASGVIESLILNPTSTPTGIDSIASEGKAKMNGKKYMENGRIVIYRDGKKFSTTGVELK